MEKWGESVSGADRLEQFKLIYDYIKFHMGLYLATPPIIAILAEAFDVKTSDWFKGGVGVMIVIFLASGIHAGSFMGKCINEPWDEAFLNKVEHAAFSQTRRHMHHTLYWVGLAFGLSGLLLAVLEVPIPFFH
jgi:hypothetical protein